MQEVSTKYVVQEWQKHHSLEPVGGTSREQALDSRCPGFTREATSDVKAWNAGLVSLRTPWTGLNATELKFALTPNPGTASSSGHSGSFTSCAATGSSGLRNTPTQQTADTLSAPKEQTMYLQLRDYLLRRNFQ